MMGLHNHEMKLIENSVRSFLADVVLCFDHILYASSVARSDLAADIRHHDEEHPRPEPLPARRGVWDPLLRGQDV